jgi:hypothetical protein
MGVEKIRLALQRRPADNQFREQLFWLVDLIYACTASGDASLIAHARLLESSLGNLGTYLETGEAEALQSAQHNLEEFVRRINAVMRAPG